METKVPYEARIVALRVGGAMIEVQGVPGWLPAAEWSYSEEEWVRDSPQLLNQTIEVVLWTVALTGQHVFSRRRVQRDPWHFVSPDWLGSVRSFRVRRLTRRHAFGEIEPGLLASVAIDALRDYVERFTDSRSWRLHVELRVGDLVAGKVAEIRQPDGHGEAQLVLDPTLWLDDVAANPTVLSDLATVRETPASIPAVAHPSPCVGQGGASVLIVEDDPGLGNRLAIELNLSGYIAQVHHEEAGAIAIVNSMEPDSVDVAVVDLHLNSRGHNGLRVAERIKQLQPRCRIILTTGEDVDVREKPIQAKFAEAADLPVAAFLPKPFSSTELHAALTEALTSPERPLASHVSSSPGAPVPAVTLDRQRPRAHSDIADRLDELVALCHGSSVHLFEINPLDGRAASVAHAGAPLAWKSIAHKLSKSPVRDVAIDRKIEHEFDVIGEPLLRRRHFWLLQAGSYRSFLGLPVPAKSANAFCLLLFHPDPARFSPDFQIRALLYAERLGRILEWDWIMRQSEQRARCEAAGLGYSLLAHELNTSLSAIDLNAHAIARALDKAQETSLLALTAEIQASSTKALSIAKSFSSISLPRQPTSVNVIECLMEALHAAINQTSREGSIDLLLPPVAPKHMCIADRTRLWMTFFNVGLNAVQQIEAFIRKRGCIWTSWGTRTFRGTEFLDVDIGDTGPGIHWSDYERIFEVGVTTRAAGTGMGLHICRQNLRAIEADGGHGVISVKRSSIALGSVFTVSVPLAAA